MFTGLQSHHKVQGCLPYYPYNHPARADKEVGALVIIMAYDKQLSSPQGTSTFKQEKTRATSAGSKADVLGVWKKSKYSIVPAAEKEKEGRPDYKAILALVSVPDSSDTTRD